MRLTSGQQSHVRLTGVWFSESTENVQVWNVLNEKIEIISANSDQTQTNIHDN